MKTYSLLLLFICASCIFMNAQRVIENPVFEVRNNSIFTISKIELSSNQTRMYVHCSFKPGWWVKFNKDQYLQDADSGEKYYPAAIEGTEFGKVTYIPESGTMDFVIVFPPLPEKIEKLNWKKDDSFTWGISLKNEIPQTEKQSSYLDVIGGNWLRTDGSNIWTYGFYAGFAIFDSKFWSYESVSEKKNKIAISLKADDGTLKQIELRLQKTGIMSVLEKGQKPLSLSREKTTIPGYNDPQDKDFDKIFHTDTARLRGYLRGYDPRLGFTNGRINLENGITGENYPTTVIIHPDGRFEADFVLYYPVTSHIVLEDNWIPFFIKPGETLMLYLDWNDILEKIRLREYNMYLPHFKAMGVSGKINENLSSMGKLLPFDYNEFHRQVKTLTPEDFYLLKMNQLQQGLEKLNKAFTEEYFTAGAKHLLVNEIKLKTGEDLFEFLMQRNYKAREDKDNSVLRIPADATYYRFLKFMPMHDAVSLGCESYFRFVNRYQFNKFFYDFNTIKGFPMINGEDELSELKRYSAWGSYLRQYRDSIMNSVFHLEPNLTHDLTKIRELAYFLQELSSSRSIATAYTDKLCASINEPVLKNAAWELVDKIVPERAVESYELQPGKGTDIFRKITDPFKGKYLFIDFWGISCGPCRSGIESSAGLREKYKDSPDFKFIYITDDSGSPLNAYNEYVEKNLKGETSHRLSDSDYNYLRELFKFNGIPHYIMVDREGRIMNEDISIGGLERKLKDLLKE